MNLIYWLGRRGLFGLVAILALIAPVYADSAKITSLPLRKTLPIIRRTTAVPKKINTGQPSSTNLAAG